MSLKSICSIIVVTILILTVTVPAVENFKDQRTEIYEDGWHYDDYMIGTNVRSVDGPLEIVTIAGTKYVHATNVGEGTLTYYSGKTETVSIDKANLDLFLALGQSNNDYVAHDPSAASPLPPYGSSYYFGGSSFPSGALLPDFSVCSFQSLYDPEGNLKVSNKIPAFCKEYYEYSAHKPYYVSAAASGSSITEWQPGESCFNSAKEILDLAIDAVDSSKFNLFLRGYTWAQGESDAGMTVEEYTQYFDTLHDSILAGELGASLDHCFLIRVKANFLNPWIAQTEIAKDNPTVTLATTLADSFSLANGGLLDDRLHYTQEGQNKIGSELGLCASAYYFPESAPTSPYANLVELIPLLLAIVITSAIAVTIVSSRRD